MKMFNQFISENIRDILKPKSKEEVDKAMSDVCKELGINMNDDISIKVWNPFKTKISIDYPNISEKKEIYFSTLTGKFVDIYKFVDDTHISMTPKAVIGYIKQQMVTESVNNILKPKSKEEIIKNIKSIDTDVTFYTNRKNKHESFGGRWYTIPFDISYNSLHKLFGEPTETRGYFGWEVIGSDGSHAFISTFIAGKKGDVKNIPLKWSVETYGDNSYSSLVTYIAKKHYKLDENIKNILSPKSKEEILDSLKDKSADVYQVIKQYVDRYPEYYIFFAKFISVFPRRDDFDDAIYDYFENPWMEETEEKEGKIIEDVPNDLKQVLFTKMLNNLDDDVSMFLPEDISIVQNFIKDLNKTSWYTKKVTESVGDILKPKSKEEIMNSISSMGNADKIYNIIASQYDYDLLPRNNIGECVFRGDLFVQQLGLTKLPDSLTVTGDFDCGYNELTKLPENLKVIGNMWCDGNKLTFLPKTLKVYGDIWCGAQAFNVEVKIPQETYIKGKIKDSILKEGVGDILKPKSKEDILKQFKPYRNVEFKKTDKSAIGTALLGYLPIKLTYNEIEKLFGEPQQKTGYITWVLEGKDYQIVTIYFYLGKLRINKADDKLEWHIGGKSKRDYKELLKFIYKNILVPEDISESIRNILKPKSKEELESGIDDLLNRLTIIGMKTELFGLNDYNTIYDYFERHEREILDFVLQGMVKNDVHVYYHIVNRHPYQPIAVRKDNDNDSTIIEHNTFVGENIKNILKPKSKEEIEDRFQNLSDEEKALMVITYVLPKKYLPKNYGEIVKKVSQEIKDAVSKTGKDTIPMGELELPTLYVKDEATDDQGNPEYHEISHLHPNNVDIAVSNEYLDDYADYQMLYENIPLDKLVEIRDQLIFAIEEGWLNESISNILTPKTKGDVNTNFNELLNRISKLALIEYPEKFENEKQAYNYFKKYKDDIIEYVITFDEEDSSLSDYVIFKMRGWNWFYGEYDNKISDMVREGVGDILKPKSEDEIRDILKNGSNVNFMKTAKRIYQPFEVFGLSIDLSYNDIYKIFGEPEITIGHTSWRLEGDDGQLIELFFPMNLNHINKDEKMRWIARFKPESSNDYDDFMDFLYRKMYLNENINDILIPKSEDDIKKAIDGIDIMELLRIAAIKKLPDKYLPSHDNIMKELDKIDLFKRIELLKDYGMDKKFMPSKSQIKKEIDNILNSSDNKWSKMYNSNLVIKNIILLDLPYDLLPLTKKTDYGVTYDEYRVIYEATLNLASSSLTRLPNNLTVHGNLNIEFNKLTELPKGLEVFGDVYCTNNRITKIAADIRIEGNLDCSDNKITSIPKTTVIWGEIKSDVDIDYINPESTTYEGINDILMPKSEDEILKKLDGLDVFQKIDIVRKGELPKKYYPPKEEIKTALDGLNFNSKLNIIRKYNLSDIYNPSKEETISYINNIKKQEQKNIILKYYKKYPNPEYVEIFVEICKLFPTEKDFNKARADFLKQEQRDRRSFDLSAASNLQSMSTKTDEEVIKRWWNWNNQHNFYQEVCHIQNKLTTDLSKFDDFVKEILNDFLDDLRKTSWGNNINEGVKDYLRPKSEEEIKQSLSNLNPIDKIIKLKRMKGVPEEYYPTDEEMIEYLNQFDVFKRYEKLDYLSRYKHLLPTKEELIKGLNDLKDTYEKINTIRKFDLPQKYMPSNQEIKKMLDKSGADKINRILHILENELDYDLLPRDKDGRCVLDFGHRGTMNLLHGSKITKLPDNMTFRCGVDLRYNRLTKLPKGLIVDGKLDCRHNLVVLQLPEDAIVKGRFITGEPYDYVGNGRWHKIEEKHINENINDILKPKSEEEIENIMINSNPIQVIMYINNGQLDKKYYPSDEAIKSELSRLKPESAFSIMKTAKLDKRFLPSDKDIRDALSGYNLFRVVGLVNMYDLPDKFMPTKQELIDEYKRVKDTRENKIWKIIVFGLPFSLLPRDLNGTCYYKGDLCVDYNDIKKLPNNLTVMGNLDVSDNHLTELPRRLHVHGDFICNNNNLSKIPDDIFVKGFVACRGNAVSAEELKSSTKANIRISP